MNWITTFSDQAIDLSCPQSIWNDLAELQKALGGVSKAFDILDDLRQGKAVGLNEAQRQLAGRLIDWYKKAFTENTSHQLKALMAPLSSIDSANGVKRFNWPLSVGKDLETAGIALKLGGEAEFHATIEAKPDLPDNAGQVLAGLVLVRTSMSGQLAAKVAVNLPLDRIAVSAAATTQSALSFDYYNLHKPETVFIDAAVAGLVGFAASPFDLKTLDEEFENRRLACLVFAGNRSISLNGKAALASPLSAGALELGELAYACSVALSGKFACLLRKDSDGRVLLYLNRVRGTDRTSDVTVKVGLDLDTAFSRIRERITPLLGKANVVLSRADELLLPGKAIRDRLKTTIGKLDSDSAKLLTPLLQSLLGFQSGQDALDALCSAISQEIVLRVADVTKSAVPTAAQLLDMVLDRLNVEDDLRSSLHTRLDTPVEKALAKIREQAAHSLKVLAERAGADEIADALTQAGLKVNQALNTVDHELEGVRVLVESWRALATKIYHQLSATTAAKLELNLNLAHASENEKAVDLVFAFEPAVEEAAGAFRQAMLGAFEKVLDLARTGAAGVEIRECRWQQALKNEDATALNVTFLGFAMAAGTILSREVELETDASGNITVASRADISKFRSLFGEKKTLRVSDVFQLASARRTRSLNLSVALSYEDQKLTPREAASFFQSLVDAGLLPPDSPERVRQYLQLLATPQSGRLDVFLPLEGDAVEALMNATEQTVNEVASKEMARAFVDASGRSERELLRELAPHYEVWATLDQTIREFTNERLQAGKPGQGLPIGNQVWDVALKVNRMHDLCAELLKALKAMRELYELGDAKLESLADPAVYQQKQREITLYAKDGIPSGFPSLFGRESVNPATIALFRILAKLAGKFSDDGQVLGATLTLEVEGGKQVKRIA